MNTLRKECEGKSLGEIADLIEQRFHAETLNLLEDLLRLSEKVERVHAQHPDCPKGVHLELTVLKDELKFHMEMEEQILFPLIKGGRISNVMNPTSLLRTQTQEHQKIKDRAAMLKSTFHLPVNACGSWTGLSYGIDRLQKLIMDHFMAEEEILFPQALTEVLSNSR